MEDDWHFISVASVDEFGVESLFSRENGAIPLSSVSEIEESRPFQLLQNRPNPFDDRTSISVWVHKPVSHKRASIRVVKPFGTILVEKPITLNPGMNEIWYEHQYHHHASGLLYYSLVIDGQIVDSKAMLHAY